MEHIWQLIDKEIEQFGNAPSLEVKQQVFEMLCRDGKLVGNENNEYIEKVVLVSLITLSQSCYLDYLSYYILEAESYLLDDTINHLDYFNSISGFTRAA